MKLTEDDIYRSSTQFKHWSFTPSALAKQRLETNIQASERVRAAVARQRAARALESQPVSESENGGSTPQTGSNTPIPRMEGEVHCLTVTEEKRLVDSFCERALELGNFLKFPIEVTATGIQYLRRFYLLNSPMTYDPQTISRSIIFIANKAEGAHLTLERYSSSLSKTTPDSILAPEYLIVQALRFNYEVRHPYRALKGGHLELAEMAKGNARLLPSEAKTPPQVREEMLKLPKRIGGMEKTSSQQELDKRVLDAYGFASHILKTAALFTDVYFLYTPSHIWLAAHLIADEPLTLFYLSTKSPATSPIHIKLLNTIRSCADMLRTHRTLSSPNQTPEEKKALDKTEKEETSVLMKKLRQCRDPDKIDLVKLNQAQKRDALASGGDEMEESTAKRRKITNEQYEKESDDFWGPELDKNGSANGLKKD